MENKYTLETNQYAYECIGPPQLVSVSGLDQTKIIHELEEIKWNFIPGRFSGICYGDIPMTIIYEKECSKQSAAMLAEEIDNKILEELLLKFGACELCSCIPCSCLIYEGWIRKKKIDVHR
jgi:hypothetical protein